MGKFQSYFPINLVILMLFPVFDKLLAEKNTNVIIFRVGAEDVIISLLMQSI
jgi:hypothetical protein